MSYHDNSYHADPLGLSVTNYTAIYARLMKDYENAQELNANFLSQEELGSLQSLLYLYCSCEIYYRFQIVLVPD